MATFFAIYWSSPLGELGSMLFHVSEKRLIVRAVRIFGKKRPGGGVSSYGATAVTKSKIVTGKTILLLDERSRPGL